MLLRIMLLIVVIALMGGCETIRKRISPWELDENSKSYNKMIRWHEIGYGGAVIPAGRTSGRVPAKSAGSEECTVTDFRVKKMECSPEKGEATVILDIDYYREPSNVKTVEDIQEWKYRRGKRQQEMAAHDSAA